MINDHGLTPVRRSTVPSFQRWQKVLYEVLAGICKTIVRSLRSHVWYPVGALFLESEEVSTAAIGLQPRSCPPNRIRPFLVVALVPILSWAFKTKKNQILTDYGEIAISINIIIIKSIHLE